MGLRHEAFVVGDYVISPTVYNLASSGHSGISSYDFRTAEEFKVQEFPFMVELETNDWQYAHYTDKSGVCPAFPGCITLIGHTGQQYIPRVDERDTDIDARVGFRIAKPRIYADIAVLGHESTFNIPGLNGVGLGLEKLPDYEKRVTVYFSAFYFPDLEGKFTVFNRTTGDSIIYTLSERDIRYQAGLMLSPIEDSPVFVDLGVLGDGNHAFNANPGSSTHFSGYAGLGFFAH